VNQKRVDFESFRKWVQEGKGRRTAEIRIGKSGDEDHVSVFVYDYEMEVGQFVLEPKDINLEGVLRQKVEDVLGQARKLFGVTVSNEEVQEVDSILKKEEKDGVSRLAFS